MAKIKERLSHCETMDINFVQAWMTKINLVAKIHDLMPYEFGLLLFYPFITWLPRSIMVIDNLIWSCGQFDHSWVNLSPDWLLSNDQDISKLDLDEWNQIGFIQLFSSALIKLDQ